MSEDWIDSDGVSGLVSIVVPTHNRAKLLAETLAAIFGQTYRPIQLVVVDDGSTDNTSSVVKAFADQARDGIEVKYLHLAQGSAPAARNAGARLTKGEYLVFMDDDDLMETGFLQSRINALNSDSSSNLAFGLWHIFDVVDGKYRVLSNRGSLPEGAEFNWYSYFDTTWQLLLQGCLIRRHLVVQAGPWQLGLKKSQDMEYKARLLALPDCKLAFAGDESPVFYRTHSASISSKMSDQKLDSHIEVLDQMESMTVAREDYQSNKELTADCLWTHSFWLYSIGELKRGYSRLQRAKVHDQAICRRKGIIAGLFDQIRLDFLIGPLYFAISQTKKAFGFSKQAVLSVHPSLPNVCRDALIENEPEAGTQRCSSGVRV